MEADTCALSRLVHFDQLAKLKQTTESSDHAAELQEIMDSGKSCGTSTLMQDLGGFFEYQEVLFCLFLARFDMIC